VVIENQVGDRAAAAERDRGRHPALVWITDVDDVEVVR
jgi:hypothetical protein